MNIINMSTINVSIINVSIIKISIIKQSLFQARIRFAVEEVKKMFASGKKIVTSAKKS